MARYSTEITGLSSGTAYDASVTARGDGEIYADSDGTFVSFSTKTQLVAPSVLEIDSELVNNQAVHNKTTTAITVRWSDANVNNSYLLEYRTGSSEAQTLEISSFQTKTINNSLYGVYEIPNLTPGTTYQIRIKQIATGEEYEDSLFSNTLEAKTKEPLVINAPTNFDMRDTKLIVRWNNNANAASYVCKARLNGTVVETQNVYESPAEFTQLVEGNSYTFGLQAIAPVNSNDYVDSQEMFSSPTIYDVSNLPAPEVFRVTDVGVSTITLQWSAVDGATGYSLSFREVGGEYEALDIANAATWEDSESGLTGWTRQVINLDKYTEYEFRIIALGDGDTVQDSAPATLVQRTNANKLNAVTMFICDYTGSGAQKIYATTDASIDYLWEVVNTPQSYANEGRNFEIEIKPTNGDSSSIIVSNFRIEERSDGVMSRNYCLYLVTGLQSGTEYQARIRAVAKDETEISSDWSPWTTAKTRTPLSSIATHEFLMRASDLKLSWGAIANAASYVAKAKTTQGATIETVTSSVPAAVFTTLTLGSTYNFEVVAKPDPYDNDHCDSLPSEINNIVYQVARLPIPETYRCDATADSITVEWSEVTHAEGYQLSYRQGTSGEFTVISNYAQYASGAKEGLYYATITGLDAITSYQFKIIALGDGENYLDSEPSLLTGTTGATQLPIPTNFAAEVHSSTSATLSWSGGTFDNIAAARAASFKIEYRKVGAGNAIEITEFDVAETSGGFVFTNALTLEPTSEYQARIKRVATSHAELDSDFTSWISFATPTALVAPTVTSAVSRTSGMTINWNAVEHAGSYVSNARADADATSPVLETHTGAANSCVFTTLEQGQSYSFGLTSLPAANDTNYCASEESISELIEYRTPTLPAPTGLEIAQIANTSATIVWNVDANASGYKFMRSVKGTNTWREFASSFNGSQQSVALDDLDPNTTYVFRVQALGDGENYYSSADASIEGTTLRNPAVQLATPADFGVQTKDEDGLDADYLSYNFVRLMWSPIANSVGYRVRYRRTSDSEWTSLTNYSVYAAGYNIDKCYCEIHSLDSITSYNFEIIALGDNVDYVNSVATTITETTDRAPATPLATPQNFAVSEIDWDSAILTWSSVANATGYRLRYKKASEQAWSTATGAISETNGTCAQEIESLDATTEYAFELVAVGDGLDHTDSDSVTTTGTTLSVPRLQTPEIFRAKDIAETSVTVEWSSAPNATGYRLRYRTGSGAWTTLTEHTRVRAQADWQNQVSGLVANTTYEFELVALGDGVNYQDSSPVTLQVATLVSGQLEPTTLTATVVRGGFFCQWEPVDGANSYVLAYFDAQNDEDTIVGVERISGSEYYWQTDLLTSDADQQGYLAIYPSALPVNGSGNERRPWSNFVFVQDTGSVPELLPPRNVSAVGATTSVITIEWEPAFGATSYVAECDGRTFETQGTVVDITGLNADTEYSIRVKSKSTYAFFTRSESDYGAPITARTAQRVLEKLEAPNIRLASKTDASLVVNWEPVENAVGYKLFYNVVGSGNPAIKIEEYELVGGKAQVAITGLAANTSYLIETVAVGDGIDYQDSDRAQLTATTDRTPLISLDAPTGLVCVDKSKDTISLEWNEVANASGYIVSYGSRSKSVDGASAVLTGLAHGRTYSIKVKAVGDGTVYSDSAYTNVIQVATDPDPIPEGERKTSLNYIRKGRLTTIKPTEVIPKGTALKQGALVGVINHTRNDNDEYGALEFDGIYNIPLANGATFALGDMVCVDSEGNAASSGVKFGFAVEATGAKSKRVKTRLVPWLDTVK